MQGAGGDRCLRGAHEFDAARRSASSACSSRRRAPRGAIVTRSSTDSATLDVGSSRRQGGRVDAPPRQEPPSMAKMAIASSATSSRSRKPVGRPVCQPESNFWVRSQESVSGVATHTCIVKCGRKSGGIEVTN